MSYTWKEISDYLNSIKGEDLIISINKFKRKFNLTDNEANEYTLIWMGYKS